MALPLGAGALARLRAARQQEQPHPARGQPQEPFRQGAVGLTVAMEQQEYMGQPEDTGLREDTAPREDMERTAQQLEQQREQQERTEQERTEKERTEHRELTELPDPPELPDSTARTALEDTASR